VAILASCNSKALQAFGKVLATGLRCTGAWVSNVSKRIAYQLAQAFKREVYRLIDGSKGATRDFKFRDQLRDSASGVPRNIGEGFARFGAAEVAHFVNIALGSLAESRVNLVDGIDRRYFTQAGCAGAFLLAKRCDKATRNFHQSLQPFIRRKPGRRRSIRPEDRAKPRRKNRSPNQKKENIDSSPANRRTSGTEGPGP
jgi:four helix bundle protein